MEVEFHLDSDIFYLVKDGTKNVEIRLNDKKRKNLKIGNIITFIKRPDNVERIKTKITALKYFDDIYSLKKTYPVEKIYKANYSFEEFLAILKRFYTDEQINKYGIVAIEFEIAE